LGRTGAVAAGSPSPAVLTTYRKDGSAHTVPVWYRWTGEAFEVVIAKGDVRRCCIWTIRGRVKLGPLSLDQIAKARSSNATVSRWPAGTSTASS
jgi:hypothetical protein